MGDRSVESRGRGQCLRFVSDMWRRFVWRLPTDSLALWWKMISVGCVSCARHPTSVIYLRRWVASLKTPHGSTLDEGIPWLPYPAIAWLEDRVRPGMSVFEFGAGGSTVFFASRGASVAAVEHDPAWAQRVRAHLARVHAPHARVILVPPEPDGGQPAAAGEYRSSSPDFDNVSFERYVRTIDACEDQALDVVLVDGRARVSCVRHAIPKLKPGGVLVLDDSERPAYSRIFPMLANCSRRDFSCFGPHLFFAWRTTIWQAPLRRAHGDRRTSLCSKD
jgi:hypothetical protein